METPRSVIEKHQSAINERDLETYIKTVIFPFTYQNFNGVSLTINSPEDSGAIYLVPWETVIAAFPDWLRTEHEQVDEIVSSNLSAVFKVQARWITETVQPHKLITAIWIRVKKMEFGVYNSGTTQARLIK